MNFLFIHYAISWLIVSVLFLLFCIALSSCISIVLDFTPQVHIYNIYLYLYTEREVLNNDYMLNLRWLIKHCDAVKVHPKFI